MNILWIAPGGIEPRTDSTIPALLELLRAVGRKHLLSVVTFQEEKGARDYWIDDVRVSAVGTVFRGTAARTTAAWVEMSRLHRARPFDLVHGFWGTRAGFLAAAWGRTQGVPSIVSYFGGEPVAFTGLDYGGWRTPQSRALLRATQRLAGRLTAASPYLVRRFEAVGLRGPWERWSIGIDQASFRAVRRIRSGPADLAVILSVADFGPIKDHRTLLETVADLRRSRPVRLRLAGSGGGAPVARWIEELGLGDITEVLGRVPHNRLPLLYRDADVLLHTSRHEGEGLVYLEAAAAGCPIVSTPVGLAEELGELDAAEIAPVGAPQAMAAAVARVLEDRGRRATLTLRAEQYARRFDLLPATLALDGLYAGLLETHQAQP